MEPRSIVPRVSKTLISIGFGLILVYGVLLLFGSVTQLANAAPLPPRYLLPSPLQAVVTVTTTIQDAINAAAPGDTVVFSGTYTEEVVINKPLTLQGAFPTSTIVYNGNFPFPLSSTIRVTADAITITNMTLRALGFVQHSAISVENRSNVNINNVTIQNYPTGIEVGRTIAGPTGITITNNIIQDPTGGATGEGGIYFHGSGAGQGTIQATIQSNQVFSYSIPPHIHLSGLAPSLIASNVLTTDGFSPDGLISLDQTGSSVIQNNQLIATGSVSPVIGIWVTGSANPTITQNTIDGLIRFGIQVDSSATPVITNSTLSGHNPYGIYIFGNSQPQIFNTTLSGNIIGINISGNAQPQISNNVISGSNAAILAYPTITPTIARNRIIDNYSGIFYNSPSPTTTFAFGNTICRNTFGLSNTSGITLSFTGNWWGHNPPLTTADISGDPVNTSPISMALNLNPSPALIPLNGTVDITLTMRGGGYNVLDGTGINFSATGGSFSVVNTTTLNGLANTVYTGTVLGMHTITVTDECGGIVTETIIIGEPALTTTKTADPPPGTTVRPGESITYTIYVTNTGNFTATGVVFSDTIPSFTQLAAATIDSGTIGLTNPVSATFNPIPPNNGVMSVTLRVTVTIPLTNGTLLTNTASISYFNGTTSVITPTNPVTHQVVSSPALTITKSAAPPSPGPVRPGDVITYTMVVRNLGDANATNVLISDTIPANTQYIFGTDSLTYSGGASGPMTTLPGTEIKFHMDYLPTPSGVMTATFAVSVTQPLTNGTIITNTAQVTSTEVATITYSNDITHVVVSSPDITITKTANPPHGTTIVPGQTITYTLTVTNVGDEVAQNVVVTDALSVYVNYVSATPSVGTITPTGRVITWTIGNLTVDVPVSAQVVVTVTTPLTNNTTILNTGYVTHMGSPVITASNTVTHLVRSSPNVTYTKIAVPPTGSSLSLSLSPPTQITYTIIVTNNGNADATGLTVTDTVPANTTGGGLVPWSPGFLSGNGGVVSNTFVVTVNVPLPDLTVITNVYEVSYNEVTGVFTSGSVLSPTNVVTHLIRSYPIISVTKTSVPTPTSVVTPGQVIVYGFTVTNSGTATATNFLLTDTIPASTTYVTGSASASPGATVTDTLPGQVQVFTPALIMPNNTLTFTFAVTVNNPLPNNTIISNFGSYTFDQSAGVSQTNVVTHLVQSAPDITLTKTAIPAHGSSVSPGERITYTIAITNNGTADATSAVLTDVVPQYTQYVTGTAFPAPPASVNPMVWNLGTIAGAGGVTTATFVVQVDSPLTGGLTISNSAQLDIVETTGLSQTNVVTHLVQSSTDITFTKSADPPSGSTVVPGDTITYTLVAANNGSQIATGVVMTDSLPAEVNVVTYTWSKAPQPTVVGNLFTWNIDTLTANETVTATIQVTVTTPLTRGTVITNQGELLTSQTGLSTTNYVTHTVLSTPTLTLSKSANPPSGSGVFPGDTITYTIAVTNSGNGPATNFLITDTVPISTNLAGNVSTTPGFTLVTSTTALTVSGTLAAGQAMTVTFAVTLSTTGLTEGAVLTNLGYVSYAEAPVISPTNAVTHLIRLTPALTLTKVAEPGGPTIGAGETITYTVIISNNDIFDASNVVITDFIPANTNYVNGSFISTQGITTGPDPLQVMVATLTGTQVMSFTFQVTVTTPITNGTIISNVAQMSAAYLSVVESNAVTHTVVATADLLVQKSATPASGAEVDPGDLILYFVQVTNNGAANATNLMITDTLPISTEYVVSLLLPPTSGSWGSSDPLTVTVPSLAGNGGTMEYMLVVTVTNNAPPGLVITNFAQVSSNETAITTTNVVTHQVSGTSVLTIAKTAIPAAGTGVRPGDPITYTVTMTNSGTNTLNSLMVLDFLDSNTTFVSSSCSPGSCTAFGAAAMWLSPLAPGNSASLEIRVTVTEPLTVGMVITNIAAASSAETGVIATDPVTHVIVSPVVVITKTDNVTVVQPGDTLTYTVTISNEGNMSATGLIVTDTVPTNTNYVAGSASGGGVYNPVTREIVWTISTLTQSASVTRTFAVTVDNPIAAGVSSITNTIVVTDDSGSSATAEDIDVVNAAPNLLISKAPSGVTEPGQVITYTITYTNTGNQDASGVVITESVPLNTNFNLGVSTPGWSCADNAPAGTNCAFNVGVVNGGNGAGSVTFAVTVTTPLSDGTIISNTAYISHDGTTVITPSNTVTHVVQLRPSLTMTKVADPVSGSTVNPDDPITYTITLINNGTGDATGVVITDVLDPNVLLASVSPPGAVSSTNPLVLDVGTVAASGGTVSYTVRVTVTSPLTNGLIIRNQAQVTAVEVPTVTLSNEVTHTVVSTPNLVALKNAIPVSGTVDPGDGINYIVQVLNNGNGPATNVMITDTIPVSTTLFSAQLIPPTLGTVVTSSTRVTATIPVLNGGGGAATLLMSVNVDPNAPPGLVITNAAQIDSDQTVLTSTNTVTHVVRELAMLTIFKAADPPDGATVSPNQMITYTLTVMNGGTTAAENMVLTDFLPIIGVTTPSNVSTTPGFTVLSISPTLVVSGTLGPGSTMTATFQVTVSNVVSGTVLTNTAQVTATNATTQTTSIAHRVVVPTYTLAITKTANPSSGSTVEPGDLITYTVTVVNNGDPVTNVVILDTLDPNVTLVTSNTTTGMFSGPNPVQVTGFNLASGESVTVTLGVTVANALSGTIIYNQASVTSTQSVSLAVSSVVTHVISNTAPLPSLAITKTATPASGSSVGPNSTITYTITVANIGTGDATNVVITDTLPITWVNLITATLSSTGTVAGTNPLMADVGTLNAGNSVTLTIVVTTSTVATDTLITNTAYVAADTLSVQASLPVTHVITTTPTVPTPTLAITKTATPASGSIVEPGDYITYTITAQNSGPGTATNVIISDTLDLANVTLVNSSTTTGTLSGPNPVQVTNFNLNPGQGVTVTLVVTVSGNVSGTVINNQASVTSTEAAMLEVSGLVTHVISSSITVPPSFTITKSAIPISGTTVTQGDPIVYTMVVVNSGGPATNVVLTDTIPAGTTYADNATATFGTPGFDGTNFIVNVNTFTAGLTLTASFRVTVTTNLTTTITNLATLDSDQTAPQNSNSIIHPVQGTGGGTGVYLPIIFRDFQGQFADLQWDNVEPVRDRVRDLDGAAGICFSFPCDGQNDGVFKLTVSLGSEGPKAVSSIRLISSQPGVEWDTIPGNGIPALGVFNGPPLNNPVDGSVIGVLLGPPDTVHLLASDDDDPLNPRFPPDTYVYTVIINFTDGTSLTAQAGVF